MPNHNYDNNFISMPFLECDGCDKTSGIYHEEEHHNLNIRRIRHQLKCLGIDKTKTFNYCKCEDQCYKHLLKEVYKISELK